MDILSKFVDMALTPEEKAENSSMSPVMDQSDYPYGLCISLCNDELEKLNTEASDFEVGDNVHFEAIGKVTAVSERDTTNGPQCRVEIQLTSIAVEDEDGDEEDDERPRLQVRNPYNK